MMMDQISDADGDEDEGGGLEDVNLSKSPLNRVCSQSIRLPDAQTVTVNEDNDR